MDRFNLKTFAVESNVVAMPSPRRRAFSSTQTLDKFYLVGGLGEGVSHLNLINNVTEFDPATLTFREMPALAFATFAPAVGIVNDTLYVFGGMYKTSIDDLFYVSHIFQFNLNSDRWTHTGRYLSQNRGFAMVTEYDKASGSLAVKGGHSYSGGTDAPVQDFEVFIPSLAK